MDERTGRTTGVRLKGGETLTADAVVSNGDVPATYKRLIKPQFRKKYTDERIEKIEIFLDSVWVPLAPEINNEHYTAWNSDLDERAWPPRRWNLAEDDDIEIWPIPDTDAAWSGSVKPVLNNPETTDPRLAQPEAAEP